MKKEGGLSEAKGGNFVSPTIFEVESDELLFRNHQEEVSTIK
jgi:hypothetical protein